MEITISDDKLLLQSFYRLAKQSPDTTYMTQPMSADVVDTFSWARALDEAKRMAAHLKSLDLPPGSKIAMLSKNCAHFILTDLAIWMAGHVSVALYPTLNADTVEYILEHSDAKVCFVGKLDGWAELAKGIPADMPRITFPLSPKEAEGDKWSDIVKKTAPIEGEPVRAADDIAIVVYTSGSTGRPKGVVHNFQGISLPANSVSKILNLTSEDRVLSYLPLAHVFERYIIESASLVTGFHIFFADSLETFVKDLQRARPTLFVSVPRLWLKFQQGVLAKMPQSRLSMLLKIPIVNNVIRKKVLSNLGLDQVRFAGSGSAPIPAELIQWYRDLGLELLEGYGMSENFSYSHLTMPGKARVGYVGNAYHDVDCKLSEQGEILVKSPANMVGYYKNDEATAESFTADGYLKTGDRGAVDEEGRLKITGRVKELFKTSKGKFVAPAPMENMINSDELVELSCVTGSGQPSACAIVNLSEAIDKKRNDPETRARVEAGLAALLASVNSKVEGYEEMQFIAISKESWTIENAMLTPTMKIKRPAIEDRYVPMLDGWYASKKKVVWEE